MKQDVFKFLIESTKFRMLTNFELPDFSKKAHVTAIAETMDHYGIGRDIIDDGIALLIEANDTGLSDKAKKVRDSKGLKHISRGYYSKSGKAPAEFKRSGDGFTPVSGDEATNAGGNPDTKSKADTKTQTTQQTSNQEEPEPVIHNPRSPAEAKDAADAGSVAAKIKVDSIESDALGEEDSIGNYTTGLKKSMKSIIAKIDNKASKVDDKNARKRIEILRDELENFINATSEQDQISAIQTMADAGVIEASSTGKKIYLSNTTLLPYKTIMPSGGHTAITREMNRIISDNKISVDYRGSSSNRALADMSGKHNEIGIVHELNPTDESEKQEDLVSKKFAKLGGDLQKSRTQNKKGADAIKSDIEKTFNNADIISARQVGGLSETELNGLGIDPKTDPTDLIVTVRNPDGYERILKYSAKVYHNPSNITMKNSGTLSAGTDYFGDSGKELDTLMKQLTEDYAYNDDMPDDEQKFNKLQIKQQYLEKAAEVMNELNGTPDGQKKLASMWNSVHGCGSEVRTIITDKRDGSVTIKSDDDYCNPVLPLRIEYDGVKVVINMDSKSVGRLQLDMKTEKNTRTKLMFRHISK